MNRLDDDTEFKDTKLFEYEIDKRYLTYIN